MLSLFLNNLFMVDFFKSQCFISKLSLLALLTENRNTSVFNFMDVKYVVFSPCHIIAMLHQRFINFNVCYSKSMINLALSMKGGIIYDLIYS